MARTFGTKSEGFKILPISFRSSQKDKTMKYFDTLDEKLSIKKRIKASTLAKSLLFAFMQMKPDSQKKFLLDPTRYPGKFPKRFL